MKYNGAVPRSVSPPVDHPVPNRNAFLSEVQKDFKFLLCIVLFFGVFRAILIFLFRHHLTARTDAWQLAKAFVAGARFDASVAAYWVLPGVLLSLVCCFGTVQLGTRRLRHFIVIVFLLFSLFLCIANAGYFAEYKDNFDQTIYGLIDDDRSAILRTAWEEYPVIPLLLFALAGTVGGSWAIIRFLGKPFAEAPRDTALNAPQRRAIGCLIALVWFALARGSLGPSPWKYNDAAKATQDDFLNKMVLNPCVALKYAIQRHSQFGRPDDWKTILPNESLRAGADELFPAARFDDNLDNCLSRTAPGRRHPPPKHIFLIVMESYDAWTMLPAYRSLEASSELSRLATNGISVKAFVPAGNMTIVSLDTILSGLPGAGLRQSYQVSARRAYPTATAAIFKRLGYTTRFINGGDPSWNRLGDFARDQGFDEVHSGHMMPISGKPRDWGWGVDDEDMFRYALGLLSDDKPSFNVIVSVSNHKPYNLDVFAMGYPHREVPPELAGVYSGKMSLKTIGHSWYADRALGRFVSAVEKSSPRCLFAITGDHWSRNFLSDDPTLFEGICVPLVLYGPEIIGGFQPPQRMAGAHIDIAPTLIELAAPAGFEYHSFGGNILDTRREPVGIGQFAVVTPEWILRSGEPDLAQTLDGKGLVDPLGSGQRRGAGLNPPVLTPELGSMPTREFLAGLSHRQRIYSALGWWRLMEGKLLPADLSAPSFPSPVRLTKTAFGKE